MSLRWNTQGRTTVSILSGSCGTEAYPKESLQVFTNHSAIVMESFIELVTAGQHDEGDRIYPLHSGPSLLTDLREAPWRRCGSSDGTGAAIFLPRNAGKAITMLRVRARTKGITMNWSISEQCVANGTPPETNHIRGANLYDDGAESSGVSPTAQGHRSGLREFLASPKAPYRERLCPVRNERENLHSDEVVRHMLALIGYRQGEQCLDSYRFP